MANFARSIKAQALAGRAEVRLIGGLGFDRVMALLSFWLISGLFLDGWAHDNIPELETFFTPWHGVMYSGFAAIAGALTLTALRNHARGASWRQALPPGYWLSLLGVALFMLGGISDLIWHELFGIEEGVDALLSPSHLLLALSGTLMISGPLRAAWSRPDDPGRSRWATQLPMLVSLMLIASVLSFFTMFANPLNNPLAIEPLREDGMPLDIYAMRADGGLQTRLTSNAEGRSYYPDISPDGQRIAFTTNTHAGPVVEIMRVDGTGRRALAEPDSWYPSWSPDGRQIAYVAERDGVQQLYLMSADGSGQRVLATTPAGSASPEWSPDGQRIAFVVEDHDHSELYVLRLASGELERVAAQLHDARHPAWAPDGRQLAFTSGQSGQDEIYIVDAAGSWRQLTHGEYSSWSPTWTADGRAVVATSYDERLDSNELVRIDLADGARSALTSNPGLEERGRTAFSADGQTLVFAAPGHAWTSASTNMSLGIASVLIYAAILGGLLLLAVRRWELAPGALALVLAGNVTMIALMEESYPLIALGLLAGLLAELLRRLLRPGPGRVRATRAFAFGLPALFFACYFAGLATERPLSWTIHLWGGSIVLAGFVGLMLSFLLYPPQLPAMSGEPVRGP